MVVFFIINNHGPAQSSTELCGKAGDIIEILSTGAIGQKAEEFFRVIQKEILIPCGDGVEDAAGVFSMGDKGPNWNCGVCKYNDPDDCERTKYLRYDFNAGTLFEPPAVIQKRIYSVDENDNIVDTRA